MEIWKTCIYDGVVYEDYMVSTLGRVKSLPRKMWNGFNYWTNKEKELSIMIHPKSGYKRLTLYKDKKPKQVLLHRLIMFSFNGDSYFDGAEVDHIVPIRNGGTDVLQNLKWTTIKENRNNPLTKINRSNSLKGKNLRGKNPNAKKVICITTGEVFDSVLDARDSTGVSEGNIRSCCYGKSTYGGRLKDGRKLVWRYVEEFKSLCA